jgi:glycosyltransferase involved in cell wall biosynthesis
MLGAFIWAFRNVADATLILKVTHADPVRGLQPALSDIAKHGIFVCRVLLIQGMLPDEEYEALVRVTSYAVNTASNEGQCLPLMEFMSAGRPAVAPAHTAMLDYLDEDNAFIVRSSPKPFVWPHDPREAIRTQRNVLSFAGLVHAFRQSYVVARTDPERYAAMSRAASAALQQFCSADVAEARLADVLAAARAPNQPALQDEDQH